MKYRKKPVVIEAVQFNGWNWAECYQFMSDEVLFFPQVLEKREKIEINTLEGTMIASVGDFIIKGVNGEFYPCKPYIFEKTYDAEEMMENKDDLTKALKALKTFTDNWCMNDEETEKQGEPVFRCKECTFEDDGYCRIKLFGKKRDQELGWIE